MNTKKVGVILSIFSGFLSGIFGLVFSSIYLKVYGSTEFGAYNSITSYAGYLAILNCGIGGVLTRYISIFREKKENERIPKFIGLQIIVLLLISTIILIVSFVMFIFIPSIYENTEMVLYISKFKIIFIFSIANLLSTLFTQAFNGIIFAYGKYFMGSFSGILLQLLKYGIVTIFLVLNYSFEFIIISSFIAQCLILLVTILYLIFKIKIKVEFKKMEWGLLKETMIFSLAIILQAIINESSTNIDKFILGIMLSPDDVTKYTLSVSIFNLFSMLSTTALSVFLPSFSRNVANNFTVEEHQREMTNPNRILTFISGLILFGFISCGLDFFVIWVGEGYEICYVMALFLMIPSFLYYCTSSTIALLDAKNKKLIRSIILVLVSLINIGATIILIKYIGLLGAPLGTLISIFVGHLIFMNIYYHKALKINIFSLYKNALLKSVIPFIVSIIIPLVSYLFIPTSFMGLLFRGGFFVVIFLVLFYFMGINAQERKKVFSFIRRKK